MYLQGSTADGGAGAANFGQPVFLLSGFWLMLFAAAAVVLWRRGRPPLWYEFTCGALAWAGSLVLRTAWQIPVNSVAQRVLGDPLFYFYAGLLIGVFECGVPLLLALRTRLKKADWNQAVAFGIGFGAIQAFLAGAATFVVMLAVIRFRQHVSPESMAAISDAFGARVLGIPTVMVERLMGMAVHAFAGVLILYAVRTREWRWFWIAFAYKAAIGTFAGWGGLESAAPAAWLAFAVVSLAGLVSLKKRFIALPR